MRRTVFCLAFTTLVMLFSSVASANDVQIAQQIAAQLRAQKKAQQLKGFHIGIKVENGQVSMKGRVSSQPQRDLALTIARRVPGVALVINELQIMQVTPRPTVEAPIATAANAHLFATTASTLQQPSSTSGSTASQITEPSNSIQPALNASSSALSASTATPMVPRPGPAGQVAAPTAILGSRIAQPSSVVRATAPVVPEMRPEMRLEAESIQPSVPTPASPRVAWASPQQTTGGGVVQRPMPQSRVPTLQLAQPQMLASQVASNTYRTTTQSPQPTLAAPPHPIARLANAPVEVESYPSVGGVVSGDPVPISGGVRANHIAYDQPSVPAHAWPSYAAHPNYAGVSYPRQYSPTAWPYIGPFYPYPQVPLGWRKVTLEWDDGWWWLDFNAK